MTDQQQLADSQLFRGLDEAGLSALLQISEMEMFDASDRIFEDGEPGTKLYIVMEGGVRVSLAVAGGGEEALNVLGPGESFGEISLVTEKVLPRSASAIAHLDCAVLSFERETLLALLEGNHEIGYVVYRNLLGALSEHLRATNDKLLFLSQTGQF